MGLVTSWAEPGRGAEQAGALEKEKGGGMRLGHRAGQAWKGKEEEGRANSWDCAGNGRNEFLFQIFFSYFVFKANSNVNQLQIRIEL